MIEKRPAQSTATQKADDARSAATPHKRHDDWRGEAIDKIRALISQADPRIVEDIKWRKPSNGMQGVPVWERDGLVCTGETYKAVVKLTFARGRRARGPVPPLQRRPRWRHPPRDRHP